MTRPSRSSANPEGARHPSSPSPEDLLALEEALAARVARWDQLHTAARDLRRASQDAMRQVHAAGGGIENSTGPSRAARRRRAEDLRRQARRLLASGELGEGAVFDALQEYAEAELLLAVVDRRRLPSAHELSLAPEVYLCGLGDVVGEVRRLAVASLTRGRLEEAEEHLALMDELAHHLLRYDAPRGIVALKPKQDTARGLVEKTRGEVVLARILAGAKGAAPTAPPRRR